MIYDFDIMKKNEYLKFASDLHQYDNGTVDWKKGGLANSPTRVFFKIICGVTLISMGKVL